MIFAGSAVPHIGEALITSALRTPHYYNVQSLDTHQRLGIYFLPNTAWHFWPRLECERPCTIAALKLQRNLSTARGERKGSSVTSLRWWISIENLFFWGRPQWWQAVTQHLGFIEIQKSKKNGTLLPPEKMKKREEQHWWVRISCLWFYTPPEYNVIDVAYQHIAKRDDHHWCLAFYRGPLGRHLIQVSGGIGGEAGYCSGQETNRQEVVYNIHCI